MGKHSLNKGTCMHIVSMQDRLEYSAKKHYRGSCWVGFCHVSKDVDGARRLMFSVSSYPTEEEAIRDMKNIVKKVIEENSRKVTSDAEADVL